jgi:DAK2 domain fusion protein YloV
MEVRVRESGPRRRRSARRRACRDLHLSAHGTNVRAVLDSLDAAAVRRWCAVALVALRRHQVEIDELNVYPVPDGDTGTNLVLTVSSAWRALAAEPEELAATSVGSELEPEGEIARLGRVLRCMARGALLGARGNSGVITSQILRGIADAMAVAPAARGRAVAEALTAAARAGYAAVAEPVEGTVLTVASAAALAATAADTDDLATVVRAAARGAAEGLAATPDLLPVLAHNGVVDAGGRGLVVLLDALVEVVTGQAPATAPLARVARDPRLLTMARETGSAEYEYEVQYLLDAAEAEVAGLRAGLAGLGDSLVIIGTGAGADDLAQWPTWNVHVHVNDVGAAIEAGVRAGRPYRISVTRFADQIAARPADRASPTNASPYRANPDHVYPIGANPDGANPDGASPDSANPVGLLTALAGARALGEETQGGVVVVAGPGLAEIFAAEGAVVVAGGPTNNPSTAEILAAIHATGATQVVLLPNDSNVRAVASAAAEEARSAGIRVGVVPTRSPVQALAAMAVRDASRRFHDDVIAMAEAAGACRWAELTTAVREALTVAGRCLAGDVLALVEGEVNLIGQDLYETAVNLLDRMLAAGGEMVTLITGAEAAADLGDRLAAHIAQAWPFVEAHVYHGGQPHYPLLVGVE